MKLGLYYFQLRCSSQASDSDLSRKQVTLQSCQLRKSEKTLPDLLKHLPLTYVFIIAYVFVNVFVFLADGNTYPPQTDKLFTLFTAWFNWSENYDTSIYPTFIYGFAQNFFLPLFAIIQYEVYSHFIQSKYTQKYSSAFNAFGLGVFSTYTISGKQFLSGSKVIGAGSSVLGFCMFIAFICLTLVEFSIEKFRNGLWEKLRENNQKKWSRVKPILLISPLIFGLAEIFLVWGAYLRTGYATIHLAGLFFFVIFFIFSIPVIFVSVQIHNKLRSKHS